MYSPQSLVVLIISPQYIERKIKPQGPLIQIKNLFKQKNLHLPFKKILMRKPFSNPQLFQSILQF